MSRASYTLRMCRDRLRLALRIASLPAPDHGRLGLLNRVFPMRPRGSGSPIVRSSRERPFESRSNVCRLASLPSRAESVVRPASRAASIAGCRFWGGGAGSPGCKTFASSYVRCGLSYRVAIVRASLPTDTGAVRIGTVLMPRLYDQGPYPDGRDPLMERLGKPFGANFRGALGNRSPGRGDLTANARHRHDRAGALSRLCEIPRGSATGLKKCSFNSDRISSSVAPVCPDLSTSRFVDEHVEGRSDVVRRSWNRCTFPSLLCCGYRHRCL